MQRNRDIQSMLKDAGILFAITLLAGLMLGFVYELTKEPIEIQERKAIQEACQTVFEGTDGGVLVFTEQTYVPDAAKQTTFAEAGVEIGETIYAATKQDGTLYGYVVEATSKEGYGGNIVLYVGVKTDGEVSGVSILEIAETPGLGMNAESVLLPQFKGIKTEAFTYTKTGSTADNEIDAISGATITTEAVVDAVNSAVLVVTQDLLKGGN